MTLTREEMWALLANHGETGELARIMIGGGYGESGWNPEAVGDDGHSIGIWQMNDQGLGAGMSVEDRMNPDIACDAMLPHYKRWFSYWSSKGYRGIDLAWRTCAWAEMPWDYENPNSAAASGYKEGYSMTGGPPGQGAPGTYYDPSYNFPAYQQKLSWTCSICTTSSALGSIGYPISPPDLQDLMTGAGLVTPADGLLDGTGAALAQWLRDTYGLKVEELWPASWSWIAERAGDGPVLTGGIAWNHWVAIRRPVDGQTFSIANSASGYHGVDQTLSHDQFSQLGPFAALWIRVDAAQPQPSPEPQPDTDQVTDLVNKIGYLQEAGSKAKADVQKAISLIDQALAEKHVARTARDFLDEAREALEAGALPATATIERGGPPGESE